ncbi:MAG: diguanylate cyclase [Pseudomonadota bacterium]|nr:diguanylate cyclase [Pseudomonadota bacterium]
MQRHRAAAASSLLALLVFLASWLLGILSTSWFLTIAALLLGAIGTFNWLFRSNLNLRFSDPSLTVAQMTTATVVVCMAMFAAEAGRGAFMILLVMVFLFGVFRLSRRAMVQYAVFVQLAFGVVMACLYVLRPETLDVRVAVLSWLTVAATLPWFAVMATAIAGLRGELVAINEEQQRTLDALHASAFDLEEAQRIAHVGSWVVDYVTGRKGWSPEMYRMFGLEPGAPPPTGRAILQLVHEEDRDHYLQVVQTALAKPEGFDTQFRIVAADGSTRWVHAVGVPVFDAQGAPVVVRGTLLDITSQKEHERALTIAHRDLAATEATLVDAIESLPDALAIFDADDRLVLCNSSYARAFTRFDQFSDIAGLTFEELVRASVDKGEVIEHPYKDDVEGWIAHRVRQHQNPPNAPRELQLGDGRWLQILERRTAAGGLVGVRRDVTERKQLEQRQQMQHSVTSILAEVESLEEAMPRIIEAVCGTMGWDCGARWQWDSETGALHCAETWGIESEAVKTFLRLSGEQSFAPESRGLIRRAWATAEGTWIANVTSEPGFMRAPIAAAAGLCSAFAFPIRVGEEPCGVLEFYSRRRRTADDALLAITQSVGLQIGQFVARVAAQDRVRALAHFDPLTGLPNRHFFQQLLDEAIKTARERSTGLALLYLDLDGFKEINDRYGHDAGDHLLVSFALRLRETLRATDAVARGHASAARIGGDEFIVLIEGIDSREVILSIAQRLLAMVAKPFDLAGPCPSVTASIGISNYPTDAGDAESLMKIADGAMYRAKATGKNRAAFAESHSSDTTIPEDAPSPA